MLAVMYKEFRSFFSSMLGYAFVAFFLVVLGVYFYAYNLYSGSPLFEYALGSVVFMFIIMIPILTMRSMADETNKKTDQLLLTSPLSVEKIIIGKFLGILAVYGIVVALSCIYPIILLTIAKAQDATLNLGRTYYAILGFFLLGAAYIAIGIFISSLTENQVISAVVTFIVVLMTYLMSSLSSLIPTGNKQTCIILAVIAILICLVMYLLVKNILIPVASGVIFEAVLVILYFVKPSVFDNVIPALIKWVSVVEPFNYFVEAVVDASYITYYLSVVAVFLLLSVQMIKKKRWS